MRLRNSLGDGSPGFGRMILRALVAVSALARVGGADPLPEFLAAQPERLLVRSQERGILGLDAAAHEPHAAGEPLRIATKSYASGLGHHAGGTIVVWLGGDYDRFAADIGVQPSDGGPGSVVFRIAADGRKLFESGVIRAGDGPQAVDVSVAGAQELVLEALDAGDGIDGDKANWADARLLPATVPATDPAADAVDVARFGRVVTSRPRRIDGANADRLEEYLADDIMLETALPVAADGGYVLTPDDEGTACIGLNWFGKRLLKEVRLRFIDRARMPAPADVTVQGWFGETAWQGNWLPLAAAVTAEGDELVARLPTKAPKGGLLHTRKVRWLLPAPGGPLAIRSLGATTRSRWTEARVRVEAGPPATGRRRIRILNGELLEIDGTPPAAATDWHEWDASRPVVLTVKHSRPSTLKADATVLQFDLPQGGVGVALADVLDQGCVYVPDRGLFVARATGADAPGPLAAHAREIAGRRSILDEVRGLPDQTWSQALATTHRAAQDEGPVMLSLAGDTTKFVVDRGGDVNFPVQEMSNNDWFAAAGDVRFVLGDGRRDRPARRLEGGWLPVPLISSEREGVRCTERVFVAPLGPVPDDPVWGARLAVCVADLTLDNLRDAENPVRLDVLVRLAGQPKPAATFARAADGRFAVRAGLTQVVVDVPQAGLEVRVEDGGGLTLRGTLPPRGRARAVVFLGTDPALVNACGEADVPRLRDATDEHWRAALAGAARIETPDASLNDVIRSSQVRCLIAARRDTAGGRLAPWIAAMAYGPFESESHAVIRGMDFLGHHGFARRGLEYFIDRYNADGFLTTGYTTFGTAWHLWTVAEHVRLTADHAWLRAHQADLRRAGDWILRQIDKTKRIDGDGRPLPEFGLMPPGVLADWNAFAYYFMLNGYYHAALRHLSESLAGIGDPRAEAFATAAEELRQSIRRSYAWTQAQSPALALRNGTWIPFYPSQVHSPGNLADFFPGDDAGRSWAYDTELGAHQLVPAGVFAADEPEVTNMLEHLEDAQFLRDGWFDYPAVDSRRDWFNLGGFAKVQPYYCRSAEIYALRDDVKPFVRSYFNSLASLLNTEVLTLWEHFRHSGAWDKTHETGAFLHQTRMMLVQERGAELWLAAFIPAEWLRPGQSLSVRDAPTAFGPVSYRLSCAEQGGAVSGSVDLPTRARPARVVVRVRAADGRAMRAVSVDGRPHREFDPRAHTVTLPTDAPTVAFHVGYE